ncbi:MAG: hypothetical protein KDD47_19580, partial [Acidobacteria bacterium]|nr:hypothetical protein [Acidobacteriota bacterium]
MNWKPGRSWLVALALCPALVVATTAVSEASSLSPHGEIRFECSECHTTAGWAPLLEPLPFRHEETGFSLLG